MVENKKEGINGARETVSLSVHNLSFAYRHDKSVIENINFSLHGGELLFLLGKNGAGKSSLFRCVLGFESRYSGEIFINGESSKNISAQEMAKQMAFVPQIHYPSFNYSAFDMVLMGTAAQGSEWSTPNTSQIQNAISAMEQIGISHLSDRDFNLISGGEQQLVLIARSIAQLIKAPSATSHKAPILVMDEPTANLDYGNQLRVLFKIKELSGNGFSILLSTHNPDHAFLFADRIIALHDKNIVAFGKPSVCLSESLIERLYGVKVNVQADKNGMRTCIPEIN
ncbi:MAG: ABC transporter ATP-binding protein [Termitinemataceae bacterium]|nr:MAG: ABC transporter ATP-binding protein [Termitinemataceae bacterium]